MKNGKHMVIPVFVPHKGCPHDCIFCNQKKISGQTAEMTAQAMDEIIQAHLSTAGRDTSIEIGFYGGSFTGIEPQKQRELLEKAYEYVKTGQVCEIRLSTRPDYISEEILSLLSEYGVRTIELGVQSLDEEVLRLSNRGHRAEDVYAASALIKAHGFRLGIQTMIGLPGDSAEKDIGTAKKVIALGPEIVRIYPALVIKGTYLETMLQQGTYLSLSLEEAVGICATLLQMYEQHGINVIRLGLQPTESINEGAEIAAGPFHPAFRQLVESRLALQKVEAAITQASRESAKDICICTGKRNVSNVIGQNRCNIVYLKEKYGYTAIRVLEVEAMERRWGSVEVAMER